MPRSEFFGIIKGPLSTEITGPNLFERAFPLRSHLDKNAEALWFKERAVDELVGPFPPISAVSGLFLAFDQPFDAVLMETDSRGADCPWAGEVVGVQFITSSSSKKHIHSVRKQFRMENLECIVLQLLSTIYRSVIASAISSCNCPILKEGYIVSE